MAEENKSYHWTDIAAENIIREKGDKESYVVAAGITPSGTVHIGNFREIITVDLVKRALEKKGKKVRFIYSWDDYDVFRKVPKNMPKPEVLQAYLRKPIVDTPDTSGECESYARYNQLPVEQEIKLVGINPEFIYQHRKYRNGDYDTEIKVALEHTEKIKEILNKYREVPLEKEWLPISVFCESCGKDTITKLEWKGEYAVYYECQCGHHEEIQFNQKHIVKLKWRIDWPMRWNYEQVDFEPGGKDHSTVGGSFDTGKQISKMVWNFDAPTYVMYDFISVKGGKGKMSSSSGEVITLGDVLQVYEPEVARYIFAGTRPNKEFNISFDTDLLNIYEDFDKAERIYFGIDTVSDKDAAKYKAAYELSFIGPIPKTIPYQPGIRHLTTLLQIYNFDVDKVIDYFEKELKNEHDKQRLRNRAECATNWINKFAPEDFRFKVQEKPQVTLSKEEKVVLHSVAEKLLERDWTDTELHEEMYILCKNNDFPTKDFFRIAYNVLINKDKGPRLASFILEIGKDKVANLFKQV
ncbi:lysine--tRNA ligase [Candidatus Woesearchaeota archaeon CG_4_10_14_0_2_um_filter_33_13]|nr:MAG: lysine--tRNA ligase [Candidatus Woesearchaeota archaeon CG_4_10_14_0_2_um_filter_33_13]